MGFTWRMTSFGYELYSGQEYIGTILAQPTNDVEYNDTITELEPGVYRWSRSFSCVPNEETRLVMEFAGAPSPTYYMIPAITYNGNTWGNGGEPKGLTRDGIPWVFAYHRCAVPGATYSENSSWSVALFGLAPNLDNGFSCSLLLKEDATIHRLVWPEEETPYVYSDRDKYAAPFHARLPAVRDTVFRTEAILVIEPVSAPRTSWHRFLDVAWQLNDHPLCPRYSAADLWVLGIRYAKECLWAEDGIFRGFSIGLHWKENKWRQREQWKYEIGWCGQNASLANSLLYDYLRTGDPTSRDAGLTALDTWANHAVLPNGLIRCHFDAVLAGTTDDLQDAANLGNAARNFLTAYCLAERCGVDRPRYKEVALNLCDFVRLHQHSDGRFGKAWSCDGNCVDPDGTIGAFLVPALLDAYTTTREPAYLDAAERGYRYYFAGLSRDGFTTAGALDTTCVDKESALPLLDAALLLHEITDRPEYLTEAEHVAYYLATWQWHYTTPYPQGTALHALKYDTFGGTAVSTQHHHQDPYGLAMLCAYLKLSDRTGNPLWNRRACALWSNASIGISDGSLRLMGKLRPVGSQDEGFYHTRWKDSYNVSEWLVAWPTALRLEVLRTLKDWSVLEVPFRTVVENTVS